MKPPAAAAAKKERFTRKKHDSRFPAHAIEDYLRQAGVTLEQVDNVVVYDKPSQVRAPRRLLGPNPDGHRETYPRFHALLGAFKERPECPVIINTSFNVRGEPIDCPVARRRRGTEVEVLALGHCVLLKEDQDPRLRQDYENAFSPD